MSLLQKKEAFRKFIDQNKILVFDDPGPRRSSLVEALGIIGAPKSLTYTTTTIEEALSIVNDKKISLIFAASHTTDGSGLRLFQALKESALSESLVLILLTTSAQETALARGLEEIVDAGLAFPFTNDSLQSTLISALTLKLQPTSYLEAIFQSKSMMHEGKNVDAIEMLMFAETLSQQPALALYYRGKAYLALSDLDAAQSSFTKGLLLNKLHYRCLTGLYEVLVQKERFYEAYDTLKKICQAYPTTAEQLTLVIRLAIQTENYADMSLYFKLSKPFPRGFPVLENYLGSGLFISGKYHLLRGETATAFNLFSKALQVAGTQTKVLRAVITELSENNLIHEAEQFLQQIPDKVKTSEEFKSIEQLLVNSKG